MTEETDESQDFEAVLAYIKESRGVDFTGGPVAYLILEGHARIDVLRVL